MYNSSNCLLWIIFNSSSRLIWRFFWAVSSIPNTIRLILLIFHSFSRPGIVKPFVFFQFPKVVCWYSRINNMVINLFLLIKNRSCLLASIGLSVCFSKPVCSIGLSVCFSKPICFSFKWIFFKDCLCIHHLLICRKFSFLHNSQSITFPNPSCLLFYSFCACLQHSLMWLIFLSLSSQESFCGGEDNMLDSNILISEFDLHSSHYVSFQTHTLRKGMNP